MKLKSTLSASLLALAALSSFNASAAADVSADAKPEAKAEVNADAKAEVKADASTKKAAAKKKIKPHSHMEEKSGVATKSELAIADEATPKKPNPANDKSKHLHARDGK